MKSKVVWIVRLAFAELRNEWLFALGVSFAVCSVLTTTSLLWGTKSGMIQGMRDRLLLDPTNRELVSREDRALSLSELEQISGNPATTFLVPSVRRISLYGKAFSARHKDPGIEAAFLPTAIGDPVGGGLGFDPDDPSLPVPCMITALLGEELEVSEGDVVSLQISRHENGKTVLFPLELKIAKSLAPSDASGRSLFLPLPVIERIEDFKEGLAVPIFGWPAYSKSHIHTYDSVEVRFAQPLAPDASRELLEACRSKLKLECDLSADSRVLKMHQDEQGVPLDSLLKLAPLLNKLNPDLKLETNALATMAGAQVVLQSADSSLPYNRLADLPGDRPKAPTGGAQALKLPSSEGYHSSLVLRLGQASSAQGPILLTPFQAGIIGAAKRRPIEFNQDTGTLRPRRVEYPGFRLYAQRLEDVAPLRRFCQELRIEVSTKEDRIESVLRLDQSLGRFLAFIVIAGGAGGLGALASSIYLSVQRSRRQFAVLQILGIPHSTVILSVALQSVVIVLIGSLATLTLFHIGSWMLASVLDVEAESTDSVCSLDGAQWLVLVGSALACAVISTLMSASRMQFKDPAVIARSE
mgnify:CR=1 FL=1